MVAELSSFTSGAMRPQGSLASLEPKYAMAYRFTLEIGGLNTGWQSCTGLSVDFNPAVQPTGGGYNSQRYLPGAVTHPRVVLKRAIYAKQAGELQKWLTKQARAWVSGTEVTPGDAKITLLDSYGKKVLTWQLLRARPAAWKGPDLDASSAKVAVETLELVHEGFTVEAEGVPAEPDPAGQPQQLTLKGDGGAVQFLYAPTEIQIRRATQAVTRSLPTGGTAEGGGGHGLNVTEDPANVTQFSLNNLVITGKPTVPHVKLLTRWATRPPKADAKDPVPSLPELKLTWGQTFKDISVYLTSLTAAFTRFMPDGTPIQAKVSLTLDENAAAKEKFANPTSGGIPGRAAHMLVAAENLPAIAQANYSSPERWRDIATANDIDDPLRVRAGTVVFLPAESELPSARLGGG